MRKGMNNDPCVRHVSCLLSVGKKGEERGGHGWMAGISGRVRIRLEEWTV